MDFLTTKNPIEIALEEDVRVRKSPQVEGMIQGGKAALLAAPLGAAVQLLRNKNPLPAAAVTGFGAGIITGLAAAAAQKYKNLKTESELRYHLRNMVDREPMVAMPEPAALSQAVDYSRGFDRGFANVHNPY